MNSNYFLCVFAFFLCSTARVSAQPSSADEAQLEIRDDEARTAYEAAEAAYEDGQVGLALTLFERAYALSPRSELLYNIGTTADRLGRTDRAMEAYSLFAAALPDHPRSEFVNGRLQELVQSARNAEEANAVADATTPDHLTINPPSDELPSPDEGGPRLGLWIGVPLAVAGAGLLATGIVGLLTADGCLETGSSGECVEERTSNTGPILAYSIVGGLALAAGVTWVIIDARGGDSSDTANLRLALSAGPQGATLQGSW